MVSLMINASKYELIGNVISLINSEEYESTIKNLSKDLNVPIPYMRHIILSLVKNNILQSCIFTDADDFDGSESSLIEDYLDNKESFSEIIMDGKYDDVMWSLTLNVLGYDENTILPLSHIEFGALNALGESILSLKRSSLFLKKDNINPLSPAVQKNCDIIRDAISYKKPITFSYEKQNGETIQVNCFPQSLVVNVSDNWIYLRSTEKILYRLDRIIHHCKILSSDEPYPEFLEDDNQKYIWGVFKESNSKPIHVKLRISPETSNIISKIKHDTSLRSETSKLYQEGNYYYYEDDVIGINELQRWIRGYGSSIIVIEPLSLRNTILSRAHETLDLYNQSESWQNL